MLRIYEVILDWLVDLVPFIEDVTARDPKLADQLSRCSKSVCLNTSEGMGATGGAKRQAYRIALREMRESIGAVDVATRLRYARPLGDAAADRQDHIVATLVKLAKP